MHNLQHHGKPPGSGSWPGPSGPRFAFWTALLVALLLVAGVPGPDGLSAQGKPGRFSHQQHGKNAENCTSCHRISAATKWLEKGKVATGRGGNEHRPCSNGGCHANQFTTRRAGAFCWSCHVGTLRSVRYPPYRRRGESEFVLQKFSHKAHIRDGNKGCEQCHTPEKKKKTRKKADPRTETDMIAVSHQVCGETICHGDKVSPMMSECASCHAVKAEGAKVAPLATSVWSNKRVAVAFGHTEHMKASKEDACGTCHTNTQVGTGEVIPLPMMQTCESCHDGTRAFSALGFDCVKCHVVPDGGE